MDGGKQDLGTDRFGRFGNSRSVHRDRISERLDAGLSSNLKPPSEPPKGLPRGSKEVADSQGFQGIVGTGVVDQRQAKALFHGGNQSLQNLGHHVFRGHQVDVVTPVSLEGEHEASQDIGEHPRRTGADTLADFEILAKNAAEIAVTEEDGSRSVPAPEAVLLP